MLNTIASFVLFLWSTPLFAQDLPEPLARFQFDGNAKDSTGNEGNKLLLKGAPTFREDALYHDGEYGIKGTWNEPECPTLYTPSLDFNAFTIAIRFKAASFNENNILAGGRRSRWISFKTPYPSENPSKNLTVTFNNQDFEFEYPVKLEVDKWYSLVCGVNLQSRTVTTYLNGDPLPSLKLPEDLKLRVLERAEDYQTLEKRWCLANYANGNTFHGLIDELAVFDGDVSSRVANDYYVDPLLVEVLQRRRGENRPGVLIDEAGTENDPWRQDYGKIERRLKAGGIQATAQGVIDYLTRKESGEDLDAVIADLVRQLGDENFQKREAATRRLRELGVRAREALQAAKTSEDPDIAFRSSRLLMGVPTLQTPPIISASDYLRARPTAKAVPCLFATLTDWRSPREFARICAALQRCVQPENRDLIRKKLASENPRVRFAAVVATERVFDPATKRKILEPYLADKHELVRLAAALSLLPDQKEEASEVLEALRDSPSFTIRYLVGTRGESEAKPKAIDPIAPPGVVPADPIDPFAPPGIVPGDPIDPFAPPGAVPAVPFAPPGGVPVDPIDPFAPLDGGDGRT